MIACDSGSTDNGPYYLGSTRPLFPKPLYIRDLRHMLLASRSLDVPLVIGSAAGAGCDAGVEFLAAIIRDISREQGLRFLLARIYSEQSTEYIEAKLLEGNVSALFPSPDLTVHDIRHSERIVGMMGAEPISHALMEGADVVVAGRASDSALFASLPLLRGIDPGLAWHAGKILECGAAATVQRLVPDCMMAELEHDSFVVWAPNEGMWCSPLSVAAHTLYENSNPYYIREPSGTLDTTQCTYEQARARGVRVRGSQFEEAPDYTVKLEAVEGVGFHSLAIAGIRDPYILRDLPAFLESVKERAAGKIREALGFDEQDYILGFRVYGIDGSGAPLAHTPVSPSEVGLMIEAFAPTQEAADTVVSTVFYIALHNPVEGWKGMLTNLAVPFSPAVISNGPAYRFSMNHIVHPGSPVEMFRTQFENVA